MFWFSLTATLLSLTTLPFGWVIPTGIEAATLVGAGLLGGVGQILLTSSYREADASLVAPFDYASMLFALAIGWFVFAEVPTVAMLTGLLVAYVMYQQSKDAPQRLATAFAPLYRFFLNKWYFDELYNAVLVRPAFWFGRLFWKQGDIGIIDRFGPNGSAAVVSFGSKLAVKMQSGYLYTYALVMLLGLVTAVSWMMVRT